MRIQCYFILFILGIFSPVFAQVKSVSFYTKYGVALNSYFNPSQFVNREKDVETADAAGGGIELNYDAGQNIYIGLQAGFELYNVHQDSALERWNWQFWETRYKGNVRDAVNSDSTLKATIIPIQKIDVYPVLLNVAYNYSPVPELSIQPSLGAGVLFYTRRLLLEETWEKKFTQVNYLFGYSFQNFAPPKRGNPLVWTIGINLSYSFSELLGASFSTNYLNVINTGDSFGYKNFPFHRVFSAKLGLLIYY